MKYYAIIVAGGSGKRMQSALAKQFLLLNKKPVMMHTLQAFYCATPQPEIVLVLAKSEHKYWEELCATYNFTVPHQLVAGGEERFHSVRNGLQAITDHEAVIAIHDAVRPIVSEKLITASFEAAKNLGNAVPCLKPSDSVRKIHNKGTEIINRDEILLVQTPQTFRLEQLKQAYQQDFSSSFTDDASVVERAGYEINIIEGDRNNIKITYPEDLKLASFLLDQQ